MWALLLAFFFGGGQEKAAATESPRTLSPFIQSIFPRGGRQGTEVEISIQGKYLGGACEIRFSGTGVKGKVLDASESQVKALVNISPDAPVGRRDLRVLTPRGSFVQVFEVGALPEQMEVEPNDDWSKASLVPLPVVVNGRVFAGDYDYFRVRASAGQVLVFDLNSSRNGTRFDAVLSILDEKGQEIASQDDYYFDKDPHLEYRFAQPGEYVVAVNGFREAGSPFSEYRLLMGELPTLSYVFPAGAQRDRSVELLVAGSNLEAVDTLVLDHAPVKAEIIERGSRQLKVRMNVPNLDSGFYPLSVREGGVEMPNPLTFAISDGREIALAGGPGAGPLLLEPSLVLNGRIRRPKQADSFWIDARAGEQYTFEGLAMRLGNFLDPAITVYDSSGGIVAYMDETAPNGFDKEPPSLDFYLVHTFERDGRYRIEMRDAGLRGRDDFVYRLSVGRASPSFEVAVLTNQVTVLPGQLAQLPVRVRRLGGWNTPVEVWVEGLPDGVSSKKVIAEPVNTRFRGTFGEDFFFDGTNVDLPLEATETATLGICELRVKARGIINGKGLEQTASIFYPWQQTGHLRGRTAEGLLLMTVASTPLFDLESPPSLTLIRGKPAELILAVRWFTSNKDPKSLTIEPVRLPSGLKVERLEVKEDKISVWISAGDQIGEMADRISLAVSLSLEGRHYRKVTPDIAVKVLRDSSRLRALVVEPAPNPPRRHEDAKKHEAFSISREIPSGSPRSPGAAGSRLVKISVFPEQVQLAGKKARQALLVTALYSNGVERDATSQARFSLKTPGVVEITSQGLVLPLKPGTVQAVAAFQGKTATVAINVASLEASRRVSFLQDISPILTQKGCTGSNCHGSVRGKAGFKLSLFGARPDLDFEAVVKANGGRRINRDKPEESLLLRKPTFQEAHGGGERFKTGSLEYQAILEWISSGLEYDAGGPKLEEIAVYPEERILVGVGSKQRLIVTGRLSGGSQVDLTQQVRYTSNDESIATVDEAGEITGKGSGETSIMVRTLGRAAVAKVAVTHLAPGRDYPAISPGNFVDVPIFAKLKKLGIVPSMPADDPVFLRRVYLDALGALPTIDETRQFLASNDPQKRSRLIDELLRRPEFVDLWALKFADLFQLGTNTGVKGGWQLYRWIRQSLADNKPYDQMVREMLLGAGSFVYDPTVNFYHGLWKGPEGMVTQVSQALLGIRMDCAKCHDHPFERWTQDDFYGMAAFFTRLEYKAESYGLFERAIAVRPTRKPSYDYVNNNKELLHPKTHQPLIPRFLTGEVVEDRPGEDLREPLADWITSPNNPWFSRAIANRIWKHYLGRGIVEPVDDFRVTNPPSNQALLDALAGTLVREKYDLKKLIKVILNSRTYQVSSAPNATNEHDQTNYSRFYLKRQIAESLYDSMGEAAEVRLKIAGYPPGVKAMSVAVGSPNYFLMTFGKTQFRDQICERDNEPNVSQAMHLVNGETINTWVSSPGNIVDRLLGKPDLSDENRVEEIYLASLTRRPTAEELAEVKPKLAGDEVSRKKAYQDLLWAILNTKEFAYIH